MDTTYSTRVRAPDQQISLTAFDDATTPNPSGRVDVDVAAEVRSKTSKNLLKPKKNINISTLNVRTLKGFKINELISLAIETKQEIICIQEHRYVHPDTDIKHHPQPNGWLFITSSAWLNSNNCPVGGVGLLLSPNACKSLNNTNSTNNRIITANFQGNPSTTIICAYSPTNCADITDAEDFYHHLADTIKEVPKHNLLLVGGDFNAQIGPTVLIPSSSYHVAPNRNGEFLLDILTECNLIALNTYYRKRPGKL